MFLSRMALYAFSVFDKTYTTEALKELHFKSIIKCFKEASKRQVTRPYSFYTIILLC